MRVRWSAPFTTSFDPKPSKTKTQTKTRTKKKEKKMKRKGPPHPKTCKPKQKNNQTNIFSTFALYQIHNSRTTKPSKQEKKTTTHEHHGTNHSKQNMQHNTQSKRAPFCILNSNPQFLVKFLFLRYLHPFFCKCYVLLKTFFIVLSATLKTLTSLNKEVRPFFLGDNSIWSYPSVSSLSDYSITRFWKRF